MVYRFVILLIVVLLQSVEEIGEKEEQRIRCEKKIEEIFEVIIYKNLCYDFVQYFREIYSFATLRFATI